MAKQVLESTVSEWQSQFESNPNQTVAEYQVDWTTIRNNSEGVGVDVAVGTVHKYLTMFRNALKLGKSFGPQGLVEPIIESTSIDTILETRANVVGLRVAIEKYLAELATIESTLDNAIAIASDNALFARLESENIKLGREARSERDRANIAEDQVKAERDLRIRQGQTHSDPTR